MSALNQTADLTLLRYAWIICSFQFLPKNLIPKSRIRLFNCCFPLICRALQMGTYLFLSLFLNSYYSGLSGSWASFYTHGAPSTWATFSFNSGLLHLKGPLKTLTGYPLPCTILSVSLVPVCSPIDLALSSLLELIGTHPRDVVFRLVIVSLFPHRLRFYYSSLTYRTINQNERIWFPNSHKAQLLLYRHVIPKYLPFKLVPLYTRSTLHS